MANNQDIFDQADNAEETKPEYSTWGQVGMELYEAVWQKGQSAPERFDASIHDAASRFIRGEIVIIPIDEMNARFSAEWKGNVTGWNNKEWVSIVLPSVKALGISARDLNNKWVKVTRKPGGRFYTKKDTGEKKELNDFLFSKIFASQDECIADYLEEKAGSPASPLSDADFPAVPDAQPAPPTTGPGNDILLKFARALVTSAAKDTKDLTAVTEKVKTQLDANPMMAGKYTVDSPEILTMIIEACQ
jgi:hypothetical protein